MTSAKDTYAHTGWICAPFLLSVHIKRPSRPGKWRRNL